MLMSTLTVGTRVLMNPGALIAKPLPLSVSIRWLVLGGDLPDIGGISPPVDTPGVPIPSIFIGRV